MFLDFPHSRSKIMLSHVYNITEQLSSNVGYSSTDTLHESGPVGSRVTFYQSSQAAEKRYKSTVTLGWAILAYMQLKTTVNLSELLLQVI